MSLKIWSMLHSQEKGCTCDGWIMDAVYHCIVNRDRLKWVLPCETYHVRLPTSLHSEFPEGVSWKRGSSRNGSNTTATCICTQGTHVVLRAFSCAYLQPSLLLVQVSMLLQPMHVWCSILVAINETLKVTEWLFYWSALLIHKKLLLFAEECMVTGRAPKQTKLSIQTVLHK